MGISLKNMYTYVLAKKLKFRSSSPEYRIKFPCFSILLD